MKTQKIIFDDLKESKRMTLLEIADIYAHTGITYHDDKTDDEILYGDEDDVDQKLLP